MAKPTNPTSLLPVRLAETLRDDIEMGRWLDHLPGGRSLAEHYGVSRKTSMTCLQILENKEVIAPAEVGKKRRILLGPSSNGRKPDPLKNNPLKGTLLVLHSAAQSLSARHLSNVNVVQSPWSDGGGTVAFHIVDYDHYSKPKSQLKKLIARYQASAFVLMAPRADWLLEASELLPTYSMGGAWEDNMKKVTAHGFDLRQQIDRIMTYLYDHGHRRMMIPNFGSESFADYLHEAVTEGFNWFRSSHSEMEDVVLDIPNFVSPEPDDWFRFWRNSLARFEPTVVIPLRTLHLQSLYGFCSASKISIPNDLSIFCAEHSIQSEWMWPRPNMQKHSEAAVRKCFKQWIDGGLLPTGVKVLPLEILEGNSVRDLNRH